MTDIRLGITLTADGNGLQGAVRLSTEDLRRLAAATDKVDRESRQAADGTDRLGREQRKTSQETRRLREEQRGLGDQIDRTTRGVNWLRLAVVALAAGAGIRLVNSFIDAASETENLRVRLRFLTDDADAAADSILNYAAKVPFTFQQIQQAAPILLAVARDQDEFNKLLAITGDIAAVSGLTFTETAQQIQRAFSAGINSADLFRERAVRSMLGFQSGVETSAEATREQILGLWEDGSFALVGAAMEMADTWEGLTSMLDDKWFQFKVSLMDGAPFEFLKAVVAETNERLDQEFGSIDDAARDMGDALVEIVEDIAIGSAQVLDFMRPLIDEIEREIEMIRSIYTFVVDMAGQAEEAILSLRDSTREWLGLENDGMAAELAALRAGERVLDSAQGPQMGPAETAARDFFTGVHQHISDSSNRERPSFGSPGATGDGGGVIEDSKVSNRTDDLLFEIELLQRTEREQKILTELRKSGSEATIAQGQSLQDFLAGLSQEERALAEATGLLYDRQQAIEDQTAADERHAEVLADLADRMMALRPPLEQAIFAADQWRTEALAGLDETAAGYQEFADQVEEIYGSMLADAYEEDLDNRRDWAAGVQRALRDAADEAGDDARAFEDLTTGALQNAEDAWVNFARTGKLSLADLGQFMQDWALRYSFQKLIQPGLEGGIEMLAGSAGTSSGGGSSGFLSALGSLFASSAGSSAGASAAPPRFFHGGGRVDGGPRTMAPGLFAMAQRYHDGGIVLKPGEVPAILKAGEFVSTPEQFDNMGSLMGSLSTIASRQASTPGASRPVQRIAITMNVNGVTDAESFRRSEGQILSRLQGQLARAGQRQG